jgi:hypothetical protein
MTRTFPSWEIDDAKRAISAGGCDKLQAMGATLYIVVEGEDPGFDIFVNGRALARNEDALEKMAQRIGIKPLLEFFSWKRVRAIRSGRRPYLRPSGFPQKMA